MIEAFRLPLQSGNVLVTAVYSNSGIPAVLEKIVSNITQADNIIRIWKKKVLRDKVSRFLNHRKNIMELHGGLCTPDLMKLMEQTRRNFDALKDASLEANCRFLLSQQHNLDLLLPGKTSRFHQSAIDTMREVYAFCQQQLKP
ncbi:MAG TPA: hypothetical protein VEB40_00925 [Flavipsychrobacter sp.]|nr:hypothetical protein [Flavipsychrobacter sp.]